MASPELRAMFDPIQSQMLSMELAYLIAGLEGRSIHWVIEKAIRQYANESWHFTRWLQTPPPERNRRVGDAT